MSTFKELSWTSNALVATTPTDGVFFPRATPAAHQYFIPNKVILVITITVIL
jgi:hypothetical protein